MSEMNNKKDGSQEYVGRYEKKENEYVGRYEKTAEQPLRKLKPLKKATVQPAENAQVASEPKPVPKRPANGQPPKKRPVSPAQAKKQKAAAAKKKAREQAFIRKQKRKERRRNRITNAVA